MICIWIPVYLQYIRDLLKIVVDDGHWVPTGTTRYGRVVKTKRPKDGED